MKNSVFLLISPLLPVNGYLYFNTILCNSCDINLGSEPFVITRGMRIAQLVIAPVTRAAWKTVDSPEHLSTTARGTGGFGSTGH